MVCAGWYGMGLLLEQKELMCLRIESGGELSSPMHPLWSAPVRTVPSLYPYLINELRVFDILTDHCELSCGRLELAQSRNGHHCTNASAQTKESNSEI